MAEEAFLFLSGDGWVWNAQIDVGWTALLHGLAFSINPFTFL